MKRILWVFALVTLASTIPCLAQDTTAPPVTLPVPEKIIGVLAAVFAVGGTMYKILDGVKNFIPGVKDKPEILKWINIIGSFTIFGAACVAANGPHDLGNLAKCLIEAAAAALVAAGFHQSKKDADLARAAATVGEFKAAANK